MEKYTKAQNKYIEKLLSYLVDNYEIEGNNFIGYFLEVDTKEKFLKATKAIKKVNHIYELIGINKVVNIKILDFSGIK